MHFCHISRLFCTVQFNTSEVLQKFYFYLHCWKHHVDRCKKTKEKVPQNQTTGIEKGGGSRGGGGEGDGDGGGGMGSEGGSEGRSRTRKLNLSKSLSVLVLKLRVFRC
jgi:hypothetical protein